MVFFQSYEEGESDGETSVVTGDLKVSHIPSSSSSLIKSKPLRDPAPSLGF